MTSSHDLFSRRFLRPSHDLLSRLLSSPDLFPGRPLVAFYDLDLLATSLWDLACTTSFRTSLPTSRDHVLQDHLSQLLFGTTSQISSHSPSFRTTLATSFADLLWRPLSRSPSQPLRISPSQDHLHRTPLLSRMRCCFDARRCHRFWTILSLSRLKYVYSHEFGLSVASSHREEVLETSCEKVVRGGPKTGGPKTELEVTVFKSGRRRI